MLTKAQNEALVVLATGKVRRTNQRTGSGYVNRKALHVLARLGLAKRCGGGGWYEITEDGRNALEGAEKR